MLVEKLIGKQLKKQREKEKLTVMLLSKRLKISERTVYRIEEGSFHLSNFERIAKIANAYNLDPVTIIKNAEAEFVQNYSGSNALEADEIERYRNTFEELNKALAGKTLELKKQANSKVGEAIKEVFETNRIFGKHEEKEEFIELIEALLEAKVQQLKRK